MTAEVAVDAVTKSNTQAHVSGLSSGLKETNGKGETLTYRSFGRGFIVRMAVCYFASLNQREDIRSKWKGIFNMHSVNIIQTVP